MRRLYVHACQTDGAPRNRAKAALKLRCDSRPTHAWSLLLDAGIFASYLVGIHHVRCFTRAWSVVVLTLGAASNCPRRWLFQVLASRSSREFLHPPILGLMANNGQP